MKRAGKRAEKGSRTILVTAGEFFLDLVFYDLEGLPAFGEELKTDNFAFTLGGGALISAAAAARLGRTAELVTAWGDTALDAGAQARIRQLGVGTGWSKTVSGRLSGLTVSVSTREDRFFLTCPGANHEVEPYLISQEFADRVASAGHVHFALTPTAWEPFQRQMTRLQRQGVTVSWDMGWDPAAARDTGFRRLCRGLDVLFLNDREAREYSGRDQLADCLEWFAGSQQAIVIKCGRQGAVACSRNHEMIEAPGLVVETIDSTGAGDAFNGGFLHAWMEGQRLIDCLRSGNVCGALSTRAAGGIDGLPDRELYLEKLREIALAQA